VSLVIPIGVIVAVAIVCIVVAVLTSAQRADEVSATSEQQLIRQAIVDHSGRALHQLESVASTPRAAQAIRDNYDAAWIDRRIGTWLETFFNIDFELIVDADDKIKYAHFHAPDDTGSADLRTELAPAIDLLRGRLSSMPSDAILMVAGQAPSNPGRSTSLVQRVMGRPAMVSAVAIGSKAELASGNTGAPIVLAVKFISDRVLNHIGDHLQLNGLRQIDEQTQASDDRVMELADGQGDSVTRLAWKPTRPGGAIVTSVVPFIAVALVGFALLVGLIIRHMRRTASAIATGERQLRHLALHDPVCGLPNRIFFGERLEQAIVEVRGGGPSAAVFYIDLDHFKDVNDTLGHHIGDELILNVTQRLSRVMRGDDLVARLGGDEFAVLADDIHGATDAAQLGDKLLKALEAPFAIQGTQVRTGLSIGIAPYTESSADVEMLMSHADVALYRAKAEGRGTYRFFNTGMDSETRARVALIGELREAITSDQLFLLYQPQVDIASGRITGVEALVRWRHPRRGVLAPETFVPEAESSGLIVALGRRVLRDACRQAKRWHDAGLLPERMAVNLSAGQLRVPSELERLVMATLSESGLPAQRLELELTESMLMGTGAHQAVLARLRARGVKVAIDEFGTGYSCLDYLRCFPVDRVKIAQTFVAELDQPGNAAVVKATIGLARELNMAVIAEGVETRRQIELLSEWGCTEGQGFYYAQPGSPEELEPLLRAGFLRRTSGEAANKVAA
jgi:diguanylate cyclase (GGDEF)-like protein